MKLEDSGMGRWPVGRNAEGHAREARGSADCEEGGDVSTSGLQIMREAPKTKTRPAPQGGDVGSRYEECSDDFDQAQWLLMCACFRVHAVLRFLSPVRKGR